MTGKPADPWRDHPDNRARSLRPAVRNPVLALPAIAELQALPPDVRRTIERILRDMHRDCRARGAKSWRKSKAPMAAYWMACGTYALHFARAIR